MANFKITKAQASELDGLVSAYENAKSALAEWLDSLKNEWEEEFGDKSEKWQDGERGQEARERIDTVGSWFDDMSAEGEPNIDAESLT